MKKLYVSLYALILSGAVALWSGSVLAGELPTGGGNTDEETSSSSGSNGVVWYDESKGLVNWEASTLDPGTGGVQLVGDNIPYRNVKEAYGDTGDMTGGSGSRGQNRATGSKIGAAATEASRIKRLQEQAEQTSKDKEESIAQALANKEAAEAAFDAADRAHHAVLHDPNATEEMKKETYDAAVTAYNERAKARKAYDDEVAYWNEVEGSTEANSDTIANSEKYYNEQIQKLKETAPSVLSEIGNPTTENWDSQMQNTAQRNALQQKFDYLSGIYGTEKLDLSKSEDRVKAKNLINTLNEAKMQNMMDQIDTSAFE